MLPSVLLQGGWRWAPFALLVRGGEFIAEKATSCLTLSLCGTCLKWSAHAHAGVCDGTETRRHDSARKREITAACIVHDANVDDGCNKSPPFHASRGGMLRK